MAGIVGLLGYDTFRETVADAMAIVEGSRASESGFIYASSFS